MCFGSCIHPKFRFNQYLAGSRNLTVDLKGKWYGVKLLSVSKLSFNTFIVFYHTKKDQNLIEAISKETLQHTKADIN